MSSNEFAYLAVGAAGVVHVLERVVTWLTGAIKAIQSVDPAAK